MSVVDERFGWLIFFSRGFARFRRTASRAAIDEGSEEAEAKEDDALAGKWLPGRDNWARCWVRNVIRICLVLVTSSLAVAVPHFALLSGLVGGVSDTGDSACMAELEQQARDWSAGRPLVTEVVGKRYLWNVFSHNSDVGETGYNVEEVKMQTEIAKIFGEGAPRIAATCVRVPVRRARAARAGARRGPRRPRSGRGGAPRRRSPRPRRRAASAARRRRSRSVQYPPVRW